MRRHGHAAHALIETLHTVQEAFGFLDDAGLRYVAGSLRVPLSRVYGAATFYHFFTMKPPGEHTCVVCTGTACYIKGAAALLASMEKGYGIKPGETTEDGKLSLVTARCLGVLRPRAGGGCRWRGAWQTHAVRFAGQSEEVRAS